MTDWTTLASTLTLSERKIAVPLSPVRPRHVGQLTLMAEAEPTRPEILPETVKPECEPVLSTNIFNFLGLPTEIRLQIYKQLLVSKVRIKITMSEITNVTAVSAGNRQAAQFKFHHDLSNNDIFPQILTTCRDVNDEATPTLYGGNIWHFVVNQWFQHFLHHVGPCNASFIRYCHLRGYALDVPEWSFAIAPCMMMNRLRTFELSLSSHESRRPRVHSDRIPGEEGKTMKALLYMRMLLQVHPSLRALIRTKLDGGSATYGYNLMLVSEEYRLEGAVSSHTLEPDVNADLLQERYADFDTEMALVLKEGRSAHLSVFLN